MTLRDSLGDPANGDDFLDALDERFGVIWNGVILHMTSVGGTANAVTATVTPAVGAGGYQNGMVFSIVWGATNTVSNVTLNGLPVVNSDGSALSAGSIESGLASVLVVVDDEFRIIAGIGAGDSQRSYFYAITTPGANTFDMPSGLSDDQLVFIECIGGGGGGYSTGGGGGGGGYSSKWMRVGDITASVTVTIGAGGVGGVAASNGGNTTFGAYLTAYGGAAGTGSLGGGGGGSSEAGLGRVGGYQGGGDGGQILTPDPEFPAEDSSSLWGGGGGGGTGDGGSSVYGGAGGAGGSGVGGVSKFNGAGGDAGVAGSAPGGGGGQNAAGARGEVRIWIYSGGLGGGDGAEIDPTVTPITFPSLASFRGDNNNVVSYSGGGATNIVEVGDFLIVDGRRMEVAASSVISHHYETDGGVKVYDRDYAAGARDWTGRFRATVDANVRDVSVLILGDSTSDGVTEWARVLTGYLPDLFPTHTIKYAKWTSEAWPAASTIAAGTGSNSITIYNGSVAGSLANHFVADRWDSGVVAIDPDLVITNYGHNHQGEVQGPYADLMYRFATELPSSPVIIGGQTPINGGDNSNLVEAMRAWADDIGAGYVDIHNLFLASPTAIGSLLSDSIHPNDDGSVLWAEAMKSLFHGAVGAGRRGVTGLLRGTVIAGGSYDDLDTNWSLTGTGAGKFENTSRYETDGHSLSVYNATSQTGGITKEVVSAANIRRYRGKWVSLWVRLRIREISSDIAGRIALNDGSSFVYTNKAGPKSDSEFYWLMVPLLVSDASTGIDAYIYANPNGSAVDQISIDRWVLMSGMTLNDGVM